jgi:hypothetical protein
MAIGPDLEKKLNKKYSPSSRIDDTFRGNDMTFITNELGEPVTLFFGKRQPDGAIKGERYVRTIKRKEDTEEIQSSHWDNKGKITRYNR